MTETEIIEKIKIYISQANKVIGNRNIEWIDEKVLTVAQMIQREEVRINYEKRS